MLPQRRLAIVLVWLAAACVGLLAQSAQENAADAARLIKVLDIHPGSNVGEIGAGGGELTIAIAREAGETGRVFSNELNPKSLGNVGKAVETAGLHNVTLVEGRERETNLPPGCCNAIFMRNVYHHFADPPTMNASLFASLAPGGRLAVIDFAPTGEEAADPKGRAEEKHHGVTAQTVARELTAAGFTVLSTENIQKGVFIVVARRPE
jgi:ubiquinone/menaquinone biosynthesis C-methylase UbiE